MLNAVMEDYLKAIYYLQNETEGKVKTSEIAEYLDVRPPTVTNMVKKLAARDLVDHEEYKGVRLTPEGEPVALEVIRHHRLLESYLTEHLDYDWSEVHEEADRLEHHISEKFVKQVATALDDPNVDPHGDPIPGTNLEPIEELQGESLDEYGENEIVVIQQVSDRDDDVLRYLSERDISPGTRAEVVEVAPFDMITIRPEGRDDSVSLPGNVAKHVRVRPAAEKSV